MVSNTQDNEIQPFSPTSQPTLPPMHQLGPQPIPQPVSQPLVQPVLSQPAGLTLSQPTQPIFTQPTQLTQPVNPLPVTSTHLGVQAQNAASPPVATYVSSRILSFGSWLTDSDLSSTQRQAYVLTDPPKRRPRQPLNTPLFCKVNGCQWWTKERGKKLARHRRSHFSGKMGVACPFCRLTFSQSARCRDHLKDRHPQYWAYIAATKGTQDAWGIRIGREMIDENLVEDAEYTPWAEYEL